MTGARERSRFSIGIVTPSYLASTPRVVKEADALSEAGYGVRVVFTQGGLDRIREHDALLLREKRWKWHAIGWSRARAAERALYWKTAALHRMAKRLPRRVWPHYWIAELSEGRSYRELSARAASERADLYIGHYPAGLAAAALAARQWGAKLGYDAEDLHTEEAPFGLRTERVRFLEGKYLPGCDHASAASEGIAEELSRRYGIAKPLAIHNVFPLSDRSRTDGLIKDRRGSELSLYWFSQTVGLDRGLQDALRACGLIGKPVQIHLRGHAAPEVRSALENMAAECGVRGLICFHEMVPPMELLSRAQEHDVGLALEQPVDTNKRLTASNKLFVYLLAGLAVAATDVPGQRSILQTCPEAGRTYAPGDAERLAAHLAEWQANRQLLSSCKRAALDAAKSRWNWEAERGKLVEKIDALLFGGDGAADREGERRLQSEPIALER